MEQLKNKMKKNILKHIRITTSMQEDLIEVSNKLDIAQTDLIRHLLKSGIKNLKYNIQKHGADNLLILNHKNLGESG